MEAESKCAVLGGESLAVKEELFALKEKLKILEQQLNQCKSLVPSQNDMARGVNQTVHYILGKMGEFIMSNYNYIPLIGIPAFILIKRSVIG